MNRALLYLWATLLKRRLIRAGASLRRPTSLIGFASMVALIAVVFHYRHGTFYADIVQPKCLAGAALLMACGSVFMGFNQRGLVFEPPDLEFLFTGPFTRQQIILYRLLPNYLYAVIQSLVFLAIFVSHLKHPLLVAACLTLFQIACFHISSAAAIFAGTIPEDLHYRLRWMMLGFFAFVGVFYFRTAWEVRILPTFATSALAQILFYPAVSLPDLAMRPLTFFWSTGWLRSPSLFSRDFWHCVLYLAIFAAISAATLWFLLKLRGDIFEASLTSSAHAAERRSRIRHGRTYAVIHSGEVRSFARPSFAGFQGVGAIIWKNLVVAFRSRRELAISTAFTLVYTGTLVALRWSLHRYGDELPPSEVRAFDASLVSLLFFLSFFLQRTLPFDFRRDGDHLVGFRTLPVGPLALTLAELAVPTALCILFQALGFLILSLFARFEWYLLLLLILVYPAVAFTLSAVWNLHYLLSATKRVGGKAESASPVREVMIVALSFCLFLPAVWTGNYIGQHMRGPVEIVMVIGFGGAIAVQYLVDLLLLLLLTRLFQTFEVSREL